MISKVLNQYTRLPKWFRFLIHPVWIVISVPFMVVAFVVVGPVLWLVEEWESFK